MEVTEFSFVALSCPGISPPGIPWATTNTTSVLISTVVLYTCLPGYKFIDGTTERIAYCDPATKLWTDVPLECLSKFK